MISVEDTPLAIMHVLFRALADTRISSANSYRILAILAEHADETGAIKPTPEGVIPYSAEVLTRRLGVSPNVVYDTYRQLQEFGYLLWQPAPRGQPRKTGYPGYVRILTSPAS